MAEPQYREERQGNRQVGLRPFNPNERRNNGDGSYSTEVTTTWQTPDGQWVNVPSLWKGADGNNVQFSEDDEEGILNAMRSYEGAGGSAFPRFSSVNEAVAAAQARSNQGGAGADAKYAVNRSTGQVMRNDGSGWSKVQSAKNAQGEILINEGGSWAPVPQGGSPQAQPASPPDTTGAGARARETLRGGGQLSRGQLEQLSKPNFQPLTPSQQVRASTEPRQQEIAQFEAQRQTERDEARIPDSDMDEHAMMLMNGATLGNGPRMYAGAKTAGDLASYPFVKAAQALGNENAASNLDRFGLSETVGRHLEDGQIIRGRAREERPVTSFAEEFVPAMLNGRSAMKAISGGVKNKFARGAVMGAPLGFTFAASENESGNVGDALESGVVGGIMGAGLGAVFPAAIAAGRPPARWGKGKVAALYDVLKGAATGKPGGARDAHASQVAVAAVRRSMERSGMTVDQILDAVAEFEGKPAVLAEVIGQDAVNALTSLTRRPGSTPQKAQAIIEERYGGFYDRASDDLRQATGLTDDQVAGKFDKDLASRREVASPLYEGAFEAFDTISSPRLKQMAESSPTLKSAMDRASKAMSDEAALAGKAPDELSQLQYWDLVKRQLDDAYEGAVAKPGNADEVRRIEMIRTEVLGQLDAFTGGRGGPYAAAREAGGEAPRLLEARAQGEKALRPSTARQTVQEQVNALNPQDRMPYASGVAAKIDEDLAGGRMTPQRLARVPANQEKLTAALGEDAGGQFVQKMEAEAKLRDTGSRWAPRMNSVTGTVAESGPSAVMDDAIMMGAAAARGDKVSLITNAIRFMRRRGFSQREIDAMGDLLLSNPQEGLRRLGVQMPSAGGGGAPANALATAGQVQQAPAQQGVNALAPVKSSGVAALRSDAGNAAMGGAVGGFAPADNMEERARNVALGAGVGAAGGRLDRILPKAGGRANRLASEPIREQAFRGATDPARLDGRGWYSSRPDVASSYAMEPNLPPGTQGGMVGKSQVNFQRPLVIDAGGSTPDAVRVPDNVAKALGLRPGQAYSTDRIDRAAEATGAFDGLVFRNIIDDAVGQSGGQPGDVYRAYTGGGEVASAGPPKIRKDVPKGTPSKAGPSRIGNTIQEGLDQSSGMGAARAVGDPQLVRKQAFEQAQKMYFDGNAKPAQIHQQTGYVPLEYNGQQILVYAPDKTPDEVMIGFYSAIANPSQATPAQLRLLETAGVLPKPLQLGGPDAPVLPRKGRNALSGQ